MRLFGRAKGRIRHAARTDVGRKREKNEDAVGVVLPAPGQTSDFEIGLIVCDGVGGQPRGEVASQLAVSAFQEALQRPDPPAISERLRLGADAATAAITDFADRETGGAPLATTVAALVVHDGKATIAHVGDSRVYRYRDRTLEPLTHDHSFVAEQVRAGLILPTEARTHPLRSRLSRALGVGHRAEIDLTEIATARSDLFLVCSDGLHAFVEDQEIARALGDDLERSARRLVDLANKAGGIDNITVALALIG